ncbi:MAG: family 1 glycosylhydrolase [Acidimicrobiales bacterium]
MSELQAPVPADHGCSRPFDRPTSRPPDHPTAEPTAARSTRWRHPTRPTPPPRLADPPHGRAARTASASGCRTPATRPRAATTAPASPPTTGRRGRRRVALAPPGRPTSCGPATPEHFDAACEAGCDAYRTSVEWTRVEPRPGAVDHEAIEHYGTILRAARNRGIEPVVALHHFTHPAWLGTDFWLRPDAPRRFADWAELIVPHLAPYCDRWITINEINAEVIGSYLIGYFPPGQRFRRRSMQRAVDNMLAAHVAAYEVIHRHQPHARVGTSTYAFWSYDVDRILLDVLAARAAGVTRTQVPAWLTQRRRAHHRTALEHLGAGQTWADHAVHRALRTYFALDRHLPRTLDAVYASPHERTYDVVQVNFYDPRLSRYLRLPGRRTAGHRHWGPDPEHWEQVPGPEHLAGYLRAAAVDDDEVWILENGLCNPVVDGVSHRRPDGMDRPTYLRQHSPPSSTPSTPAWMSPATTPGRCSTTTSGVSTCRASACAPSSASTA